MRAVEGPAFAIYGVSTERKLVSALSKDMVDNGFLNRFLFFNVGRGAPEPVDPQYSYARMPGSLRAALRDGADRAAVGTNGMVYKKVDGEPGPRLVREFRRIGWDTGIKELWRTWVKHIRAIDDVDERALWMRAPEYAMRLATVEAFWRGANVVDATGWHWARVVVDQGLRQLHKALRQNMSEDMAAGDLINAVRADFQKEKYQVLVTGPLGDIKGVGQLTYGEIKKLCERRTHDLRKIDLALSHLLDTGEIVEVKRTGPGRPARK
jgi:hypothetical protein